MDIKRVKRTILGPILFITAALGLTYLAISIQAGNTIGLFIGMIIFSSLPIGLLMYLFSGLETPTFWSFLRTIGIVGILLSSFKIFVINFKHLEDKHLEDKNLMIYVIACLTSLFLICLGEIIRYLKNIEILLKQKENNNEKGSLVDLEDKAS